MKTHLGANASELNAGELVKSVSIEGLLAQRDAVLHRIRDALDSLQQAQQLADDAGLLRQHYGFPWVLQGKDHYRHTDLLEPDVFPTISKRVDAGAWDHLMNESGLMTFLDSKARAQWQEKIQRCETPALTRENIAATFGALYASRHEMFERGVVHCFESLSWDYRTNNPVKFGRRIIKHVRSYGHFDSRRVDELADLQRVFCILDGKPEEDHRAGLYQRLAKYHGMARGEHDDTYMHLRWFKNNNGHITFKRPDLVAKLNAIIAKHYPGALPAPQE